MDPGSGHSNTSRSSRSRRRAVEACSFCRRRKVCSRHVPAGSDTTDTNDAQIKCNNERPVCVNCKTYAQDCVYEPIGEDAKEAGRERHQRAKRRKTLDIDATGVELRRRSLSSSHNGNATGSPGTEASAPNGRDGDMDRGQSWRANARGRSSEASVARILVSANGVSSYHGRTSALFEDNVQDRPAGGEHRPRMPDDWVERGLVAEAVRQRRCLWRTVPSWKLNLSRSDGGFELPPG